MDSILTGDFETPFLIGTDELSYLKDCIENAQINNSTKEADSIYPAIGNIEIVYKGLHKKPKIQFTPSGWSRLYRQDVGDILKDLSCILSNSDFSSEIKVQYPGSYTENSIDPNLVVYKIGKPQLDIDVKSVQIYDKDGVDILLAVWNKMVNRFNKECCLLDEQLELPIVFD
ncbi:MAG: hypothetical protein GQ477_05570 [Nanohaloarchaea archaeon]|nr:hypothetical protein [Candidatus Nanohaloarchaea archaeon]